MAELVDQFLASLRRSRAHRRSKAEWIALFDEIKKMSPSELADRLSANAAKNGTDAPEGSSLEAEVRQVFGIFRGTQSAKFGLLATFIPAAAETYLPKFASLRAGVNWLENKFGQEALITALALMRTKGEKERRVGGIRPPSRR